MAHTNFREVFKRLGMSKYAYLVYDIVLKNGPLLPAHIAEGIRAHRPAVYKSLYELQRAKLLIKNKQGGRFYWQAASPDNVMKLFNDVFDQVKTTIPKAKEKFEEVVTSSMRIFHGPEGIRAVFDDVVKHSLKNDTFFRYTSEKDLDVVNSYLSVDYRKKRDAKNLERLVISNPVSAKKKKARLERFIKFIPPEVNLFNQNIIELIYRDRIAFIDLNKQESLIIENQALTDFQKVIFKQLYKKL